MKKFFNGYAYKDAVWLKSYNVNGYIEIPKINNPDSKHRLFSIKTEDIEVGEGIKGKINGFQNLKKDVKYMLYVHEGTNLFTPKSPEVEAIPDVVKPNNEGSFTISEDIINNYPSCAFIVGFEYAGKVYYGSMKTVGMELCPDDNHPHAIDLGLPSGTKWACCNVGASKPEDYGNYYAWGEIRPKSSYNWYNYAFIYGELLECSYIGSDIAGTSYDAATANMGAPWRMPSFNQIEELYNNTTYIGTTLNGVNGNRFIGHNGASIFLPFAASRWYDKLNGDYNYGDYWSSTYWVKDYNDCEAYDLHIYVPYFAYAYWGTGYRAMGLSVRAVR